MTGIEELGALAATAAPYITAASAVAGVAGSIAAGHQQSAALQAQAAAARTNAGAALDSSEADVARLQDRARRTAATLSNDQAGAGIDPASGSSLDVLADTAGQGALDSEIARWRGQTQANAYLNQGAQQSQAAGQADEAGWINAGSTLLTTGARYAIGRGSGAVAPAKGFS